MFHSRSMFLLLVPGILGILTVSSARQLAAADVKPESLTTFAAADLVIGQPDFSSNNCHQGDGLSASDFCDQEGALILVGKKLYAADSSYDRVLGFKNLPTKNGASADFVLGQPNFSSGGTGNENGMASSRSVSFPCGIASDGKKLIIAILTTAAC